MAHLYVHASALGDAPVGFFVEMLYFCSKFFNYDSGSTKPGK